MNNLPSITKTNVLLCVLLLLTGMYFFAAPGTSDTVAWSHIAKDTIKRGLFEAHAIADNIYPPFSTFIISFFANYWFRVFGATPDEYGIAIKLSILTLYILGFLSYFLFSRVLSTRNKYSFVDVLMVFLSVFSLTLNSLSLTYVDFYIVPTVVISFYFLHRKKYFLSGLFLSIACLTKWQPLVLTPLFFGFIFDIRQRIYLSLRNSIKFGIGFLPLYLTVWIIFWLTAGGPERILFSLKFFLHPPNLSGNALNLSWVLTYFLHIFSPETYLPLRNGMNFLIRAAYYPPYTSYIFYLVSIVIFIRFLLLKTKNFERLLSASVMLYFSHYILNRGVHEQHLFYTVSVMILLFLFRPSKGYRLTLILFDLMNFMNLVLFYGLTGDRRINPMFFGMDLTVLFAAYYVLIYIVVLKNYIKKGSLKVFPT